MRTELEFQSSAFPPAPEDTEFINPGRHGLALAHFLMHQLDRRGWIVRHCAPEDWGWLLTIENPGFALKIGCGNRDGEPDGYLCFIEPSKPRVWRWFRWLDTRQAVGRIGDEVHAILKESGKVRNLRWSSDA